ncbi:MAG: hypothetical protein GDA51_13485 [Ekhidna sp.]|nr:hypothetical protein [Ekhidna sp.]
MKVSLISLSTMAPFLHQNTSAANQRKLRESGEPFARYPVLKKQNGNRKERKCNRKQ